MQKYLAWQHMTVILDNSSGIDACCRATNETMSAHDFAAHAFIHTAAHSFSCLNADKWQSERHGG